VVTDVKEGISGFFTRIKDKITGFFSGIWDGVTSFFGGAAESFSAGYGDATAHAEGGILTRPHVGLVAEDGAEAKPIFQTPIAPSAGSAAGGISGGAINVPVTIENVTFDVTVSGGEAPDADRLVEVIKENVRNLTDEIAYRLALALQQTFADLPLAAEGV
jgi:hypothetical protein